MMSTRKRVPVEFLGRSFRSPSDRMTSVSGSATSYRFRSTPPRWGGRNQRRLVDCSVPPKLSIRISRHSHEMHALLLALQVLIWFAGAYLFGVGSFWISFVETLP